MPAASNCRVVDCARQESAQSNDVFAAIDSSCKNCVGTAIYGFLSLSHRYAMPSPPSGGAKERTVVTLPSSDEEGADAVGGRRDNAHSALCRLTGSSACGAKERTVVTLPSSDDTHRRPCCAGFRQRRAGNQRFRAGWSRAASSTRLLKEGGSATYRADGRRDNAPSEFHSHTFLFQSSPTIRRNPP